MIKKFLPAKLDKFIYVSKVKTVNYLKRSFKKKTDSKYLFILSPPFCGSTLLSQIISLSKSVSTNNTTGTREGQRLPKVYELLYKSNSELKWDPEYKPDWQKVKNEWNKYWDITKPVLLEKSPPTISRAYQLEEYFSPSYYIIFYRNPYAHSESLIRNNDFSSLEAAEKVITFLKFQKKNIEDLSNSIQISYEELTENTSETIEKIKEFLPQLSDITIEGRTFSAHNYLKKNMKITNLNNLKISKLGEEKVEELNMVFTKHAELLSFFGYEIFQGKQL